jgi:hypothetical protein
MNRELQSTGGDSVISDVSEELKQRQAKPANPRKEPTRGD